MWNDGRSEATPLQKQVVDDEWYQLSRKKKTLLKVFTRILYGFSSYRLQPFGSRNILLCIYCWAFSHCCCSQWEKGNERVLALAHANQSHSQPTKLPCRISVAQQTVYRNMYHQPELTHLFCSFNSIINYIGRCDTMCCSHFD